MKMYSFLILAIISCFLFVSCDDVDKLINGDEDPNELGGSTDIPINSVGNEFGLIISADGESIQGNEDIKIKENQNGVLTLTVKGDLSNYPEYVNILKNSPIPIPVENGIVNFEAQFKSTSNGIQDNFNADKAFVTLAKYDAKVGDTYTYTPTTGEKIVRRVTKKSTSDDFEYGFMHIKVIEVEQETTVSGIDKFIYKVNHKYGLVHFIMLMEDGSTVSSYVLPQIHN
jgi:hypothetical protein